MHLEPKKAIEVFKRNDSELFMNLTRKSRISALLNYNKTINKETLSKYIIHIEEEMGIMLTTIELEEIIKLYPIERSTLVDFDFDDTDVRDTLLNIVSNFLCNTDYITYKDTNDGVKTIDFHTMILESAKYFGFKITQGDKNG